MPLNNNPAFRPILSAVEMIAGDNIRKQSEERAQGRQIEAEERSEQRQIGSEERQMARSEELIGRQARQREYDELTNWIGSYESAVTGGAAKVDPETLKQVVARRNELFAAGGIQPKQPVGPMAKAAADTQEYRVSKEARKLFNLDPDKKEDVVDFETKIELEKETFGNKLDRHKTYSKTKTKKEKTQRDKISGEIDRKLSAAEKVYNEGLKEEGAKEKTGVIGEVAGYYIEKLRNFRSMLETNQWDDSLSQELYNMEDFQQFYEKNKDQVDDDEELNEIIELLKGE